MNNKGQVLVFFVVLIPVFIALAAFAIDISYTYYQSNKLDNINRMVIKYGLNNLTDDDIKSKMAELLLKNDSDISNYEINIKNNVITLKAEKEINSIFSGFLNIETYHLSSDFKGYNKSGKVIIKKG